MVNVEYNYVHDYGAGITNDYGGIKTGSKSKNCGVHPELCHNYIRLYNNLVRCNLVCREEKERYVALYFQGWMAVSLLQQRPLQ